MAIRYANATMAFGAGSIASGVQQTEDIEIRVAVQALRQIGTLKAMKAVKQFEKM